MRLQINETAPDFDAAMSTRGVVDREETKDERGKRRHGMKLLFGVMGAALLTTAVSFGLSGAASATSGGQAPLKATFSGTVAFINTSSIALHGAGHSTLMGASTNDGLAVISGPPNAAGCIPNADTETLTAANGDQLVIESDNLACPTGPTSLHGTGHWHVVSGTGRFKGATGEGTFDGEGVFGPSFSPGTISFTLTGTIARK